MYTVRWGQTAQATAIARKDYVVQMLTQWQAASTNIVPCKMDFTTSIFPMMYSPTVELALCFVLILVLIIIALYHNPPLQHSMIL